jgi:hypothetical protein
MSTMTKSQSKNSKSADRPRQRSLSTRPAADVIRDRAYAIYQVRMCNGVSGDQLSDWLQAEQEIEDEVRGEVLMKGDPE